MTWRLARSLVVLRDEADAMWPSRSKRSDGAIGDADHRNRTSDHNPWAPPPDGGVVTALDLTHDPQRGADMDWLAEHLRESRDPRVKYVIRSGRMYSSYPARGVPPWTWRGYSGPNSHETHLHVSVQPQDRHYDDPSPWLTTPTQEDAMRRGDVGPAVGAALTRLMQVCEMRGVSLDGLDVVAAIAADEYTGAAAAAVDRWRKSHGIGETGELDMPALVVLAQDLAELSAVAHRRNVPHDGVTAQEGDRRYSVRGHAHTGIVTLS